MRYNRIVPRLLVFGLLALLVLSMTMLCTAMAYAKGSHRTDGQDSSGNTTRSVEQGNSSSSSSSDNSRHSNRDEIRRVDPKPDTPSRSNDISNQVRREDPPVVERRSYQPSDNGSNNHRNQKDPPVVTRSSDSSSSSNSSEHKNDHGTRDSNTGSSSSSENRYTPGANSSKNSSSNTDSSSNRSNNISSSNHRNSSNGSSSNSENSYFPNAGSSSHRDSSGSASSTNNRYVPSGNTDSNSIGKSTTNHRPVDKIPLENLTTRSSNHTAIRDTSYAIPEKSVRHDVPKSTRIPEVTGVYRKDFADLADIWKTRREHHDNNRRDSGWSNNYKYDNRSHTNVSFNFNFFPNSRYRYYTYDYDPWYSYPSMYCYYYGLFPPYIYGHRVVYVRHNVVTYRYVDVPITIIYRDRSDYRSDDSDYYLSSYRYRNLDYALKDIERAWTRGDADLLMDHVIRGNQIDVFLKDEYSYSLEANDFEEITRDAMSHIDTNKFDFYRIRQRDSNTIVAYAEHQYRDDDTYYRGDSDDVFGDRLDKKINKVYVQYTLTKIEGDWYIMEVGTSPNKKY